MGFCDDFESACGRDEEGIPCVSEVLFSGLARRVGVCVVSGVGVDMLGISYSHIPGGPRQNQSLAGSLDMREEYFT